MDLLELPDFSEARHLQLVDLSYCTSLCNVHSSILCLHSLVTLNLNNCYKLKCLQSEIPLKSLKDLSICCWSLKEFSLSSEEITKLNLSSTFMEILGSSIECLSRLRSLHLNGLRLRILPINDLCRLTYLQKLSLFNCGRVIDEEKLRILFDALHSLGELHLEGFSDVYELPDNISALSCLRILSLTGICVKRLPASIKHISNLKTIELRNCEKLQFVPELPPFITHLDAYNCTSLKTVSTSTTCTPQQVKEWEYVFSFKNCKTLNENSLIKFAQFCVKQAVYNNPGVVEVWYPGNRVPEWFKCQQTKASINIELAPPFDRLKGFVLCCLFSQPITDEVFPAILKCQCYFQDDKEVKAARTYESYLKKTQLNSDHVLLWYKPFDCEDILEEFKSRGGNDEVSSYKPKLSFEFSLVTTIGFGKTLKPDDLIKACGVCPIYASTYPNSLPQTELEIKKELKKHSFENSLVTPIGFYPTSKRAGFDQTSNKRAGFDRTSYKTTGFHHTSNKRETFKSANLRKACGVCPATAGWISLWW